MVWRDFCQKTTDQSKLWKPLETKRGKLLDDNIIIVMIKHFAEAKQVDKV